ncbi:hypothetical protein FRC07_010407 [Ceratobasidium sp. 392]|nr:hypothetical protein FRC07_010407 [Ceratobasidium sp. 392]
MDDCRQNFRLLLERQPHNTRKPAKRPLSEPALPPHYLNRPAQKCRNTRTVAPCHDYKTIATESYWRISHVSVTSTGDIPFRVIRPVLEKCKAHKLTELEQASPHLKNDTQVIWKKKCLDDFIDIRQSYENGSMEEPRSWRKRYLTALDERERKISDSASRLRGMYQQGESSKRDRQTLYTTKAPPPKRGRFVPVPTGRHSWSVVTHPGSIGISKPRTLIAKARQDTKKIQHVWTAPSGPSSPVVRRKVVPLGYDDLFKSRPTQSSHSQPVSTALARKGSSVGMNGAGSTRLDQKSTRFEGSGVD